MRKAQASDRAIVCSEMIDTLLTKLVDFHSVQNILMSRPRRIVKCLRNMEQTFADEAWHGYIVDAHPNVRKIIWDQKVRVFRATGENASIDTRSPEVEVVYMAGLAIVVALCEGMSLEHAVKVVDNLCGPPIANGHRFESHGYGHHLALTAKFLSVRARHKIIRRAREDDTKHEASTARKKARREALEKEYGSDAVLEDSGSSSDNE